MTEPLRCHGCKTVVDYHAHPSLWLPVNDVHEFTQSLVIMTHAFCCGIVSHTEPVATVSAYLRPVKEHARLMCNLMNAHLLAGRPQPQWLIDAWVAWERNFTRGEANYARGPERLLPPRRLKGAQA